MKPVVPICLLKASCFSLVLIHFSQKDELVEAQRRLDSVPSYALRKGVLPEQNFPDAIDDERLFSEGAKKTVTVNAYERDPAARTACLKRHGHRCAVCNLSFEELYGIIGKGFIHVHHKKPLSGTREAYKVNPLKDLVPVCPNCHAMLHTTNPPIGIEELRNIRDTSHLFDKRDVIL